MSLLVFGSLCSSLHAQAVVDTRALDVQLQNANSALQTLDLAAEACVTSLADTANQEACDGFEAALNGEPLAAYIKHCDTAKAWRETVVTRPQAVDGVNDVVGLQESDSEVTLDLLIRTEYLCGDDALRKRTSFVAQAYGRLRQSALSTRISSLDPGFQQLEHVQQFQLEQERQRLRQILMDQAEQRVDATRRLQQQLELELLRNQLP